MTGFDSIIADLERQRAAIDNALEALRGMSEASPAKRKPGRPKGVKSASKKGTGTRRSMSAEGRARQIEAMKAYWAAKKAGGKKARKKRAAKEEA